MRTETRRHEGPIGASTLVTRYTVRCTLLEDAHPGSGSGGAGIDALVARCAAGKPVIWREHLEGLLREEARIRKVRADVQRRLFGCSGGSGQVALFTSLYAKDDPDTRIWRSSARKSFDNRAPRDDTLRAIEAVPAGTTFMGRVELEERDVQELTKLLHGLESIGASRNSGFGRVEFTVKRRKVTPRPLPEGSGTVLRLLLRNLDPMCITATAMPGNIVPTHSYIPGRAAKGAIVRWLLDTGKRHQAALAAGEQVAVSNGYLLAAMLGAEVPLGHVEVLPAPLSLRRPKPLAQSGEVPWWSLDHANPERADGAKVREGNWKRCEPDLVVYRSSPAESWRGARPDIRVRLRNGRDDPAQRDPSLFAFEQIAEGSRFLLELSGNGENLRTLCSALAPLLDGSRWLRVGRGGAPVVVERAEWVATPSETNLGAGNTRNESDVAYLTLTSDLLVRDAWLRWIGVLRAEEMHCIEGWPESITHAQVSPVAQEECTIRGFNGTSRLPQLPHPGIRRGSVFQIRGRDAVLTLAQMAERGAWLGEQTHIGFGRFRIDTELPGCTQEPSNRAATGEAPLHVSTRADSADEAVASRARDWAVSYAQQLRSSARSDGRAPSGSQWRDLLGVLYQSNGGEGAILSRLHPTTRGGGTWRHPAAVPVLQQLQHVSAEMRAVHCDYFVQWIEEKSER